jgi:hypothetical protein
MGAKEFCDRLVWIVALGLHRNKREHFRNIFLILPETRNTGADNLFDLLENPADQGLRKLSACPHR